MDRFWLEKAIHYIQEHNAFNDVAEVENSTGSGGTTVSATVSVSLPSKFIKPGITEIGVRDKEEVSFIFPDSFPLKAPKIKLRSDFPRNFPHINPSETEVYPCVFYGDSSELLQQSEWMNGILNQVVDWLERAASNELLDYDQGWEPMRNDHFAGFMLYDLKDILGTFLAKQNGPFVRKIVYEEKSNGCIVTDSLCDSKKHRSAHALFFKTLKTNDVYIPNTIKSLDQLYLFAESLGIEGVKKLAEKTDFDNLAEDKLFIVLAIRRPVKIINSDIDIEFLNFVIEKEKTRKSKKRLLPGCPVKMLSHINDRSPTLLRQLSGTETRIREERTIALVGCGSLGSKIGMHLVRNGNGPFLCIDDDMFMPHNNARHALTLTWVDNKADLLSLAMFSASKVPAITNRKGAFVADYSTSRLIIDSTASLSVKSFLMNRDDLPPVISGALYGQGRYGLLLLEDNSKECRLTDLWAHLYLRSLTDNPLRKILFDTNVNNVGIGQGCSSLTTIVDDSRISLIAAAMSLKIQKVLEDGLAENGEILFSQIGDDFSLKSSLVSIPKSRPIKSARNREWSISLSEEAYEQMRLRMNDKSPNETGGVLLGTVFLHPKKIVITALIDAPPDSIETPTSFMLGTEGLENNIKNTERKTNGKITYLGTWHSHPRGGAASQTDDNTYTKLLFVRNYEPTICLIITQNDVIAL